MSVAIEEGRVADIATEGPTSRVVPAPRVPLAPASRRPVQRRPEKWASTLEPADLALLLAVIETRVIPRLVADFTPARCASLASDRARR